MERCWSAYLGGADRDATPTPRRCAPTTWPASPPAYIAVAGHDVLRDDGLRYAEALRAAGRRRSRCERFDDMVHGFLRWGGVVDRARELIDGARRVHACRHCPGSRRRMTSVRASSGSSIAGATTTVSRMYQGQRAITLSSEEWTGFARRYM